MLQDVGVSWEHIGSKTCGKACHLPSSADNGVTMELATVNEKNPCGNRGFHLLCQPLAPDGTKDEKWRRPHGLATGLKPDIVGGGWTSRTTQLNVSG